MKTSLEEEDFEPEYTHINTNRDEPFMGARFFIKMKFFARLLRLYQ